MADGGDRLTTADRIFDAAITILSLGEGSENPIGGKAGKAVYLTLQHPAAKKELIARGWKPAQVDAMSPAQVVLLRTTAVYREMWDDQSKLFFSTQPFARAGFAAAKERLQTLRKDAGGDPMMATFALVFPAVEKVHGAYARTERKVAALTAIEAIRLHAATTGKLPSSLDDVTIVPVPADPGTGKPFVYRLTGDTATFSAPTPAGELDAPHNALTYELKLRGAD